MPGKVYCDECKYFKYQIYTCECEHPENWVSTWKSRKAFRDPPKEINRDNNCPWYESKEE